MKRKRRKGPRIHPKYIYIFFSILCAILVVLSFKFSDRLSGAESDSRRYYVSMQSGINQSGKSNLG